MLLNSADYSLFFPKLWKLKKGQYEAFSYLGFPVIVMCCLAYKQTGLSLKKLLKKGFTSAKYASTIWGVCLLTLLSLGERIRILRFLSD